MKNAQLSVVDSSESQGIVGEAISGSRSRQRLESQPAHTAGEILAGKYLIEGLLGEGGMGTVWRARSLALDIDVAIKVLHAEHADSHAAERLRREARATASLGHPSVVRVFDFGETETGEPFLVMELLEGSSLARLLDERGNVPASDAVQLLLPVASGLAAAHARGVIHRDIKPENILLTPNIAGGTLPKIVDFGIAKLSRHGGQVITQAGMVLGSLEYMSPEQAEGKHDVDEQTDVWALCVVLYELLTGQRPFQGPNIAALIFALYSMDPAPITEFGAGDDELWQIIARGLQKDPANRWSSMLELGRALASWAVERGIAVDAAGQSIEHHWLRVRTSPSDSTPPGLPGRASQVSVMPQWPRASFVDHAHETSLGAVATLPAAVVSPRAGTLEIGRAPTQPAAAPSARRWTGKLAGAAAMALFFGPLLIAGGLYGTRGSTTPTVADVPIAVPAPVITSAPPTTIEAAVAAEAAGSLITRPAAPSVAPPPKVVTPTRAPSRPHLPRTTVIASQVRSGKPLPLPPAPTF